MGCPLPPVKTARFLEIDIRANQTAVAGMLKVGAGVQELSWNDGGARGFGPALQNPSGNGFQPVK
jgi:hypothetical protein